jgi:hypothetical protein
VKGVLRITTNTRNPIFYRNVKNQQKHQVIILYQWLRLASHRPKPRCITQNTPQTPKTSPTRKQESHQTISATQPKPLTTPPKPDEQDSTNVKKSSQPPESPLRAARFSQNRFQPPPKPEQVGRAGSKPARIL